MKVWRISKERHVETAFSGEGSRLAGARWNPRGTPMVYTSLSLSLALVEIFVHLEVRQDPGDLMSIEANLPTDHNVVERIEISSLPADWRRLNHPELHRIGAEWARSMRSLVLLVPSAAVDGEWNALLNPVHRDAADIKLNAPKPFRFDPRMFGTGLV